MVAAIVMRSCFDGLRVLFCEVVIESIGNSSDLLKCNLHVYYSEAYWPYFMISLHPEQYINPYQKTYDHSTAQGLPLYFRFRDFHLFIHFLYLRALYQ